MPLFRVRPEVVTGRTVPAQFAGSIFDLVPAQSYEIELHAVDTDGSVDQVVTLTGATRPVPPSDPKTPNKKNVTDAVNDTKKRLGSDEAFASELRREGMSEDDLRKRYREEVQKQLLANALLRKQLGKMEITPAEAEKYFTEHKDKFPRRPSAIKAQVIQIPIEPDSLEKAAVKKRANDALARIKKGEPFSRLAQTLSEDPGTAQSGGDLGWFKRGSLDSTFELAAFKVPVGQVSGVVTTPFGYHLIKVEEADAAKGEIHARHILFRVQPSEADANRTKAQIREAVSG